MSNPRLSRNIAELRRTQLTSTRQRSSDNVLASLRATQILNSKPFLPAELIAAILDYVPAQDLARCARVSRKLQEIAYDDTRWIRMLKAMGVWKEGEARQHLEEALKRKAAAQTVRTNEALEGPTGVPGRSHAGSVTIYDAGLEENRLKRLSIQTRQQRTQQQVDDGFDQVTATPSTPLKTLDPRRALTALDYVRSIRGRARQEFGKVYALLGPFYKDLVEARGHSDPAIFRAFHDPEDQAQILSSLSKFAHHDVSLGYGARRQKLSTLIDVFERAVLREFEHGLSADDVDGRMKRYAHVLTTLNGGWSGVDAYISHQPVFQRTLRLGSPLQCVEDVAPGHVDLNASQKFFEQLTQLCIAQSDIIQRVFPRSLDVLSIYLQRLCAEVLTEYITTLYDEAHLRGIETYVKAVSGTFTQALYFAASITPTNASPADFAITARSLITVCFEKHIDLYLAEELALFKSKTKGEIEHWEKEASEQQATAESYFMSNISRQAAKRDFLSSFKKVVMMPVNVLPFGSSKPVVHKSTVDLQAVDTAYSRPRTPTLTGTSTPNRASTPRLEAPTTELAAKTAIMNSRLEGIKSLFSIEVALNLTHFAKASLERAAVMVKMGGSYGNNAREQCEVVFVELLAILGNRHVKTGFDKAVEHLSTYDPRQMREYRANMNPLDQDGNQVAGVEPLMTFLELVNVGDLIQQMIDVFYNEELLATKLTERDDFLDPAVKEKKRFEQMLDERVAAGLSKGIDVLMDEVEYLCATTQPATDFNPVTFGSGALDIDIGPSSTAKQIIDMVSSHTGMLVGSTDKTMLDVFMQEVGLRLFGVLCKHIKRQRISVDGAIKLISDVNHYAAYITSLRQKPIQPYFSALRELGQIYLVYIDPPAGVFGSGTGKDAKRGSLLSTKATKTQLQAKELATIIADSQRYYGIFPAEEVYEFAERRADWYLVKGDVERAMYGVGCTLM